MTFIERLEQLRQEKGITRKKLLEDCKLGKNQFTYWEKNNAIPPPLSAYPNPTLYGERYSFKQKDTLYHNGRGCLPLFSGETVRFGTFQRTQNHFVLRQSPLLDLVDRCPTVSIPFHNLFSVMDYHTLIEIYQLVQRQIL